ncbi:MAG: hypothetical protein PVI89_00080 [Desulfobacteraceae bacterium]|jgi:hypothetical protein
MQLKRQHIVQFVTLGAVFGVIWLTVVMLATGVSARAPRSPHHVYVAFGFHGNLYHSFRNDTNDESGFGKDIRVIRHIIETMDRWNRRGVPVKAVWDFDNLFSLQEILPQYAPDIITNIRRRIRSNGDEAILMSYNNGLVSAMNGEELTDAMRWAISNPWHSGVRDLFGSFSPIVRPQEMMTTPGNFSIYRQLGIQAVALYYSPTPFDAFRVFSRPLTQAEAYNPILYKHPQTGEEMVVIPSYHIGDLVEHVSLRNWVEELRSLQEKGELQHDALIFINYDADSDFWSGVDLPWPLKWMPNTHGIDALVRGVADLPYVRFTTLNAYLQNHPPVGTFHFSQDTADGSFNGYNSWAEKSRVGPQWTQIERSRRLQAAAGKAVALLGHPPELADIPALTAAAEQLRLRALSTTHFGMATPFVAPQREQAANALIARLTGYSDEIETRIDAGLRDYLRRRPPTREKDGRLQWLDTFVLLQPDEAVGGTGRFLKIRLAEGAPAKGPFLLKAPNGNLLQAIDCYPASEKGGRQWLELYLPGGAPLADGVYHLYRDGRAAAAVQENGVRAGERVLSNGTVELRFDADGGVEGIYLNGVRQAEPDSLMPYVQYGQQRIRIPEMRLEHVAAADKRSAGVRMSGRFPGLTAGEKSNGQAVYTVSLLAHRPYLLLRGKISYPVSESNDIIKADEPGLSRRLDMRWREVAPAEIQFSPKATRQQPPRILKRNYLGVETHYTLDYFRHSPENLNLDNVNNHITQSYVGIVSGEYGMAIATDTTIQANFAFAPLKMTYDPGMDSFQIRANPFGTYHGRQYRPPTHGNGQGYEMTLHTGEQLASAAPTYNGVDREFHLLISFFKGKQMPPRLKEDLLGYAHPPVVISLNAPAGNIAPSAASLEKLTGLSKEIGSSISSTPGTGLQYPKIPLGLKVRVLWANVRELIDDVPAMLRGKRDHL